MVAARVIPAFRAVDTPHASLRAATRPRHSCASASTTSCSASSSDRRGRSAELPAWRASRRELASLSLLSVAGLASLSLPHPARAETLYELFDLAQQLGQRGEFEEADKAWTRAIELDPKNSASWSNRGTARLQACRWKDVRGQPCARHTCPYVVSLTLRLLCCFARRLLPIWRRRLLSTAQKLTLSR